MDPGDFALYCLLMAGDDLPEMSELFDRPGWMADASCRDHPKLNWHPARGEDVRPLKAVCAGCLVREECLSYALEHDELEGYGMWGGLVPRARVPLRAQRPRVVERRLGRPVPCEGCGDGTTNRLGLCTLCRHYKWKYGRLPDEGALQVRRERQARRAG